MNRYSKESLNAFVASMTSPSEWMKEVERLREENDRLRELLKECRPYVESGIGHTCDTELCDRVEKEVSDEMEN